MGLLDFFKRNKKTKAETVKTKKPSPEHTLFADTVLDIISPTVEKFGFIRHRTEIEKHFTTIFLRCNIFFSKSQLQNYSFFFKSVFYFETDFTMNANGLAMGSSDF